LPRDVVESEEYAPTIGGYTSRWSRSVVMLFAPLDAHEVRQARLSAAPQLQRKRRRVAFIREIEE
jgi:hypothetical protein